MGSADGRSAMCSRGRPCAQDQRERVQVREGRRERGEVRQRALVLLVSDESARCAEWPSMVCCVWTGRRCGLLFCHGY